MACLLFQMAKGIKIVLPLIHFCILYKTETTWAKPAANCRSLSPLSSPRTEHYKSVRRGHQVNQLAVAATKRPGRHPHHDQTRSDSWLHHSCFPICRVSTAQSVKTPTANGNDFTLRYLVRRSGDRISVGGARFSAPVQIGPGAHPASYTYGTRSFPGVKRPGRGVDHPLPSSTEVKERVNLYLYPPPLGLRDLF